jgi:hypothetical protein
MNPPPMELAAKIVEPDQFLGSHVAVLDFVFYTGNQFPEEFRGGAFLAYHGTWNRSKRAGYVVEFIPFDFGEPSGKGCVSSRGGRIPAARRMCSADRWQFSKPWTVACLFQTMAAGWFGKYRMRQRKQPLRSERRER